jgi:hypothetical protein
MAILRQTGKAQFRAPRSQLKPRIAAVSAHTRDGEIHLFQ